MKKTAKSLLLVTIVVALLLALTGCSSNKLVATKSSDEGEEKIEITFKDDKVNEVVMTMEFKEESEAESIKELYDQLAEEAEGMKIEQKGKKIILTVDAKTFAEMEGADPDDESLSKEEIKKSLEDDGYTVK